MLRQSFSTSSRALRSNSKPFAQAAAALIRTQPAPAPPLTPASWWASRAVVSAPASRGRWYSDKAETAEKKKEGEGETSQAEAQSAESASKTSDVEAELKKKLETKEREAIDWKVSYDDELSMDEVMYWH